MNKNHLSETAEIKAGNWKDNLNPFKLRPRFGSGHFAFAAVLMFTFFTFPGTVYAATTVTTSQSSQTSTEPENQPNSQAKELSTKTIDKSLERIEGAIKRIEDKQDSWLTPQALGPLIVAGLGIISGIIIAWMTASLNQCIQREEHVFNSLQWLSGKTQRRSIGIAVKMRTGKNSLIFAQPGNLS